MAELIDVDLDALAPAPKRVKLAGKTYKLPGDMPLPLFFRLQAFEQRVEKGESEVALLSELSEELLGLFQVHQPQMKELPDIGALVLMASIPTIYRGEGQGEAQPPQAASKTPRSKKRTPSKKAGARARPATSR